MPPKCVIFHICNFEHLRLPIDNGHVIITKIGQNVLIVVG